MSVDAWLQPLERWRAAPSVIVFLGASVWGLFWLPLRAIDEAGLSGPWAIVAINVIPALFLLPVALCRRAALHAEGRAVVLIGLFIGAGLVFYSLGLIYTSIVRATLLYYLTPIWSTLFARVILGERVTFWRWLAIVIGFVGLFVILGLEDIGQADINRGDVMGFLSGILWGIGATYMRKYDHIPVVDTAFTQYVCSAIVGLGLVLLLLGPETRMPGMDEWRAAAPAAVSFAMLVLLPSVFMIFWGAQRLSPGRVGILMMSEVLVACLSAPLLAGEALGVRELAGAVLILGAGAIELMSPAPKDA